MNEKENATVVGEQVVNEHPVVKKKSTWPRMVLTVAFIILSLILLVSSAAAAYLLIENGTLKKEKASLETKANNEDTDSEEIGDELEVEDEENDDVAEKEDAEVKETPTFASDEDFIGWNKYTIEAESNLKEAQIRYTNDWSAKVDLSADDYSQLKQVIIQHKSSINYNYYISVGRLLSGNWRTSCSNINEETQTLTYDNGSKKSVVDFTKVTTFDESLYILKTLFYPDYIMFEICDSRGRMDTSYGGILLVMPKNYTNPQFQEALKIISSLELK